MSRCFGLQVYICVSAGLGNCKVSLKTGFSLHVSLVRSLGRSVQEKSQETNRFLKFVSLFFSRNGSLCVMVEPGMNFNVQKLPVC